MTNKSHPDTQPKPDIEVAEDSGTHIEKCVGKYTPESIKRFFEAGEALFHQGFGDLSQLQPVERLGYESAERVANAQQPQADSLLIAELVEAAINEAENRELLTGAEDYLHYRFTDPQFEQGYMSAIAQVRRNVRAAIKGGD